VSELKERLWTVMVYMVGDAGLDYNGFTDLKEMKLAGSSDEVALLAQFCRGVKNRPTKRYHLTKDSRDGTLAADVIEDLGETDPASPETVAQFFCWGIEKFPARRYMAVLWGHGNGANDETLPNLIIPSATEDSQGMETVQVRRRVLPPSTRAIAISPSAAAFDAYSLDSLDCRKFQKALHMVRVALGRKLDILGMDSCVMSGAEVCYQIRDSVRLTVAPEGSGPVDGWPYDKVLGALVENPAMNPETLATTIAENFVASYADCEDLSVTQAVCDLDKCELLASAIDRLAETLIAKLIDDEARKAMMLARLQAQAYESTEYIDLYDFCALLREHSKDEGIRTASGDVMEVISSRGFVLKALYRGDAMQYSYGLSIYFPLHEVSRAYERLDIARDTRWVTFLKEYLIKIRRPNRGEIRRI
jgi:Clostripain family